MTRKCKIVNYTIKQNANYDVGNENYTEDLKSNLCKYKDAYILVKHGVTAIAVSTMQVSFKNCALLLKISPMIFFGFNRLFALLSSSQYDYAKTFKT